MATGRMGFSALAAALLATSSGAANAARVDYVVDAGVEYDDNVRLAAVDPIDQRILRAGLGFLVSENTSTVQASVDGRVEYRDFEDGAYSNSVEATLDGRLNWVLLPERLSLLAENSLGLEAIDRFDTDSPDNRQQVNVFSVGPVLQFGMGTLRGQAQLRYIDTDAEVTDEFNSQRVAFALRGIKDLSPTSNVSANLQAQDVDYEDDLQARDHQRINAFMRLERTYANSDLALDLGHSRIEYEQGGSESGPLLRASLGWRATERSRLQLSARTEFSDAGDSESLGSAAPGDLPTNIDTGSTTITPDLYELRAVDLDYSYAGTRFSFTAGGGANRIEYLDSPRPDEDNREMRVTVDYRLRPSITLGAYADFQRTRYGAAFGTEETWRAGVRLTKQWSRHWSGAVSLARYGRESGLLDGDVDQNIIYVGVRYQNR